MKKKVTCNKGHYILITISISQKGITKTYVPNKTAPKIYEANLKKKKKKGKVDNFTTVGNFNTPLPIMDKTSIYRLIRE